MTKLVNLNIRAIGEIAVKPDDSRRWEVNGTYRIGNLDGYQYADLRAIFGEPTFGEPSGDGKVFYEWVIELPFEDGTSEFVTIYDWKSMTRDVADTRYDWSIGGRNRNNVDHVISIVKDWEMMREERGD